MNTKNQPASHREPLSDAELARLRSADIARIRLSEDETSRLREINERRRQEHERNVAEWRRAERPLARELRSAGFDVESAWDLRIEDYPLSPKDKGVPYSNALPILLSHLDHPYADRTREGIARSIAVGRSYWVKAPDITFDEAWERVMSLYLKEEAHTTAKEGLAAAISEMANAELVPDVLELLRDATHGVSRLLLLSVLARTPDSRAGTALIEFRDDPVLAEEVRSILRRRRRT